MLNNNKKADDIYPLGIILTPLKYDKNIRYKENTDLCEKYTLDNSHFR
jgi:hypothetical protein